MSRLSDRGDDPEVTASGARPQPRYSLPDRPHSHGAPHHFSDPYQRPEPPRGAAYGDDRLGFLESEERQQREGVGVLISLSRINNSTRSFASLTAAPETRAERAAELERVAPEAEQPAPSPIAKVLGVLKDPALRSAMSLMLSAVFAGALNYFFWVYTAHKHSAVLVGHVSAEVSAITFLAGMGSLNLINIFARFLPEAGWNARRMIIVSYGGVIIAGSLCVLVFMATPLSNGLILGGNSGKVGFAVCVLLTAVFMIQDGGLVGFGRSGWVPIENTLVALVRLALVPIMAGFLAPSADILWAWAIPMGISVFVINSLNIGPLSAAQARKRPQLPPVRELGSFIAVESVTTAISGALTAFLPALVTRKLGASQGGYFYVPWIITAMASLLLMSILISMVREAVANPKTASPTIRRSVRLVVLVVGCGMIGCTFLSGLLLAPLGHDYVVYGTPLLRWVGLSLPAAALNLLFWSTCLTRRRPWPVFALNLALSVGTLGGVVFLGHGSHVASVGMVYCIVQWVVAACVLFPTIRALKAMLAGKLSPAVAAAA